LPVRHCTTHGRGRRRKIDSLEMKTANNFHPLCSYMRQCWTCLNSTASANTKFVPCGIALLSVSDETDWLHFPEWTLSRPALGSPSLLNHISYLYIVYFTRAIFKLYIHIPTNCTQLLYFINNTLKHMYCLKL
jgi:hypothetical protein